MKRATRVLLIGAGAAALVAATAFALLRKPTSAQIETCRVVMARETDESIAVWRARAAGEEPPERQTKNASLHACAPLYSLAACREARLRFEEPHPAERLSRLAETCRDAYCPVLASKPRMCAPPSGAVLKLADHIEMWLELDRAILSHELGARAAPILAEEDRRRREVAAAIGAYMDAGSPAWDGVGGGTIRMVPKTELPESVREHVEQQPER